MLPERPESPEQPPARPRPQPEFVGAPTEYADAQEVPESLGLLAKIVAGGALTWGIVVGIVALLGVACTLCSLCVLFTLR